LTILWFTSKPRIDATREWTGQHTIAGGTD
jgi:hypothetical protein